MDCLPHRHGLMLLHGDADFEQMVEVVPSVPSPERVRHSDSR